MIVLRMNRWAEQGVDMMMNAGVGCGTPGVARRLVEPTRGRLGGRVRRAAVVAAVVIASVPAVLLAQSGDRVRLTNRGEVSGQIAAVSPNEVQVRDQRDETKTVPIDQIREVLLDGEPASLRNARGMLSRQDFAGAVEELKKIEPAELEGASNLVLAELDFVKAAAAGGKATATGVAADQAAGEAALRAFLTKHAKNYNFYRAAELLGDLLAKSGKYPDAATAYAALEKGPPAFRVRAATAKANLFYAQQKYDEALKEFDSAIKIQTDPKDDASARQKREADLGRARCMSRQGQAAAAVDLVLAAVKAADPEDKEMLGKAYNVLGDAYKAAGGKDQDALIAFLMVDLVYNGLADSHAEALFNLGQLWDKAKNPERARQAKQTLQTTYPDSPWTKKLGAAGAAS